MREQNMLGLADKQGDMKDFEEMAEQQMGFTWEHMRLLSSEADLIHLKSRVVSEAEQVLCKESAEATHRTPEVPKAMNKQFQARWRQAEAEFRDMCDSNSAQVQALVRTTSFPYWGRRNSGGSGAFRKPLVRAHARKSVKEGTF